MESGGDWCNYLLVYHSDSDWAAMISLPVTLIIHLTFLHLVISAALNLAPRFALALAILAEITFRARSPAL